MANKTDSTHLATLQFAANERGPVKIVPLEVEHAGRVLPGEPLEIGITVRRPLRRARKFMAALDWPYLYLTRLRGKGRRQQFVLERRDLSGDPTEVRSLLLGHAVPTALRGLGDRCLVAIKCRVWLVRFPDGTGVKADEFTAPEGPAQAKPVDIITVDRGRIAAVDDCVWPKFVFMLRPGPGDTLEHRLTAQLPDYPNESYYQAVLSGTCLALTSSYAHRNGHGQRLVVLRVGRGEAAVTAELSESGSTIHQVKAWLQEFFPLEPDEQVVIDDDGHEWRVRTLTGDTFTRWRGLGIVGPKLLIGAGERGILVHPCRTDGTAWTQLLNAQGTCLDLVARDGRGFALVHSGRSGSSAQLVSISWNKARRSLDLGRHHDLPGEPTELIG